MSENRHYQQNEQTAHVQTYRNTSIKRPLLLKGN